MSILLLKAEQKEVQWGEPEEGKQKSSTKRNFPPLSLAFPVAYLWFLVETLPFFATPLSLWSKSFKSTASY